MAGWLLLFALTGCAAFAALGVTVRAAFESRTEAFLVWTALFFMLIATPVMALGYTNQLRPAALAAASFATSAAVFFASTRGRGLGPHLRQMAASAAGFARMPWEGFRLAVRARSF